ncbi:hypothetical protein, partial [Roseibium sp. TrichSKD4]|uniref:hypothetical protein n=1 Tax=Roseibium sp. TrichSKD4 TaxID=744980 RepID=UPI00058C3D1E
IDRKMAPTISGTSLAGAIKRSKKSISNTTSIQTEPKHRRNYLGDLERRALSAETYTLGDENRAGFRTTAQRMIR